MPYREKRIYSGKYLEVEIYSISKKERNKKRKRKQKESLTKQKNLNDKNAKKHLIRLVNANFSDNDLAVHLTYDNKNVPTSEDEARKHLNKPIQIHNLTIRMLTINQVEPSTHELQLRLTTPPYPGAPGGTIFGLPNNLVCQVATA